MNKLLCFIVSLCCCFSSAYSMRTQIIFWHSMAGQLGEEVRVLTEAFNDTQNEFEVIALYKGNYVETMTSFAAAFKAKRAPALVQIFEAGTAIMHAPAGVIKPVADLVLEQNLTLPTHDFLPSIRDYYSYQGKLQAFPFNISVPLMYYNAEVLAQLGYAPENFPRTWSELASLVLRINKAGYRCSYTSAYPGWILLESFMAIHGLPLLQGTPPQAALDTPQLLHHLQRLKTWQDHHYYRYAGRVDDATILFTSGVCPLFSQSSGAYNSLQQIAPFKLGIARMPLDTDISTVRHANITGGAALWVVSGKSAAEYRGIALFLSFLSKPEIQQQWHERTGYLPVGIYGIYSGILRAHKHPGLLIAEQDLNEKSKNTFAMTVPQNQVRMLMDELLEAMFAGLISPETMLRDAQLRIDRLLKRFLMNTGESHEPKRL
ncbi:MAG: glycerol-3-phosphate ABC transporter substrate-binding protein [Legionella sp. 40-6]|nr:extracellular solute-binding protein [Legionella sp.]OJY44192.1 MAG: glycerol-3-phosphate ABC transporter substrate-binding protein [Legionella sp. 40-6]